jgi:hypothetical protein
LQFYFAVLSPCYLSWPLPREKAEGSLATVRIIPSPNLIEYLDAKVKNSLEYDSHVWYDILDWYFMDEYPVAQGLEKARN